MQEFLTKIILQSWLKIRIHMKYSPCFRCYMDTCLHSQDLIILVDMPLSWTYLNLHGFLMHFLLLDFIVIYMIVRFSVRIQGAISDLKCVFTWAMMLSFFSLSDCCYDTTDIIGRSQACFSNNACDELANIWWMPSCLWKPSILTNNEGNTIWRSFLWFDLYF
jgi:hypothetical protein